MILPSSLNNYNLNYFSTFNTKKLKSTERIGPHNIDIISIIMGSTLGDTHLEKRNKGIGTRIIFEQSNKNVEYLMWFYNYFSSRGYCSSQLPKLHIRIKQKGEVLYHYRVNSYTYSSFN
jgi:ubiquinol-cytochrome c reductase cytochrome b subunit